MNADEMFEQLGFKKIEDNKLRIRYEKEGYYFDKEIVFNKIEKHIISELTTGESAFITIEEVKAINEKCKELGWME